MYLKLKNAMTYKFIYIYELYIIMWVFRNRQIKYLHFTTNEQWITYILSIWIVDFNNILAYF